MEQQSNDDEPSYVMINSLIISEHIISQMEIEILNWKIASPYLGKMMNVCIHEEIHRF